MVRINNTIQDVAREAGVSITTVSRVINDNYPVKEETRKRVEDAITKLDFTPNILARGLIQKRTYTIGVILPGITNLFFTVIVRGIQKYITDKNYTILLCDSGGNCDNEKKHIQNLLERRVDGIISIDPSTSNIKDGYYEKISNQLALVLINGYNKNINCNFVINNEEKGTVDALEYLISLGHTNIVFVRGSVSYSYDLKEEVYRKILTEHNLPFNKENIITIPEGNSIQAVEMTSAYLIDYLSEHIDRPTAIFTCNDWMAQGALNACTICELNVPGDISIIGYDNIIISKMSVPKLTTVDQNMKQLGILSAEMLYNNIENPTKETKKIILDTTLIVRESTGVANNPKSPIMNIQ